MAFLARWWQSFLHTLSLGKGERDDGWVEPGNEITRTILSGAIVLPALQFEAVELPVAASEASRLAETAQPPVADAPDVPVEAPAAAQQREAPATRTRKRRGRRAA